MVAAEKGDTACVQILINHNSDVNIVDINGNTPLMATAGIFTGNFYRLDRGVSVEATNAEENEILTRDSLTEDTSYLIDVGGDYGYPHVARLLIAYHADVNWANCEGNTALMGAAQSGKVESIEALLEAGADLDARNKDGLSALSFAVIKGREAVVRTLLERGADLTLTDRKGYSLLERAEQYGHSHIVSLLKNAGAR